MANILSKAGITDDSIIKASHITQSIDALTAAAEYNISISGSLTITSSLSSGLMLYNKENDTNLYIGFGKNISNTRVGVDTLYNNTTGTGNTAMGYQALYNNTTNDNNTAIGFGTLYNNTTGNSNTAMGYGTLYNNTTGNSNTAIGRGTLLSNTEGTNNTAIGYRDWETDRKSTRLNSSHSRASRMPSSA